MGLSLGMIHVDLPEKVIGTGFCTSGTVREFYIHRVGFFVGKPEVLLLVAVAFVFFDPFLT